MSDKTLASSLFSTLKTYQTQENDYISSCLSLLSDQGQNSITGFYQNNKQALLDVDSTVTDIYNSMPKTFATTAKFNTGWNEIDDCRVMRKNMLLFEAEGCHKFTWTLYVAICVIAVGLFILVLFSWSVFCLIRVDEGTEETNPTSEKPMDFYPDSDQNKLTVD